MHVEDHFQGHILIARGSGAKVAASCVDNYINVNVDHFYGLSVLEGRGGEGRRGGGEGHGGGEHWEGEGRRKEKQSKGKNAEGRGEKSKEGKESLWLRNQGQSDIRLN